METIHIVVQSIDGSCFTLTFDKLLPLVELKALIAAETAVGPDVEISLISADVEIPRTSRLAVAVLGIENGSVLTVVKRASPRLLTTSWDETAKIWNFATGECLLTLFPH